MTEQSSATWNDWIGSDVVDPDGDKIGSLDEVYMDRASGQPEWLAVKTGLFGSRLSFIPIAGVEADGHDLKVAWAKDHVKDAPNIDPQEGHISDEQEAALYQHYGRSDYQGWGDDERDLQDWDAAASGDTGTDVSGPETDSAMTRSEEELAVGTRNVESGRVRLRKYVVTENVTTTVPVRKEKLRIEREPITEANAGAAMDGPDISEEEHELVLSEEEVVVDKKVVPKERIRADKDVEVEEREVSDQVRKEQVEVDDGTRQR